MEQVEDHPDSLLNYHSEKIDLNIPEISIDFILGERFAHSLNIDQLSTMNYQKDSNRGEEIIVRTIF